MKRFTSLLILFLTLITCSRAQVITITFEGTLNATPIPLDSILVMNLTAGGDTMIYFPDNVLELGVTAIHEVATQAPVLRNQPNPFVGATDILLSTRNSGQALMTVHDATGREVAAHAGNLAAGQHRFSYTAASPGVHLLTVWQSGERATHRLVALAGERNADGFTYAGSNSTVGTAKSDRSLFTWTPGDELRYIGYATDADIVHSAAIDEVPAVTATRTFVMFSVDACANTFSIIDIDGNAYPAVSIGNQCWMAANLRTARYRDGTIIPNVTGNTAWTQLNSGAWCNYNNSPGNDPIYGKLYNWYAASNPNICPQGWHLPTDVEWQQLEATLGMHESELDQTNYRGVAQNVGGQLKATTLWNEPNIGATDERGFSSLPGGYRSDVLGGFSLLNYDGFWWSASQSFAELAWSRGLEGSNAGIYRSYGNKRNGFCVRCVRD